MWSAVILVTMCVTRVKLLGLLLVAMVASACGGSTDGDESAAESSTVTQTADDVITSDEGQPEDASPAEEATTESTPAEKTTLEDYLGVATAFVRGGGLAGGDLDVARISQEQQLIEIEIQRCMQQQGFEYTPEQASVGIQLFGGAEELGLTAAEYAETQGFGISTRFDAVFEGDIDLTNDEASENELLLDSLSDGEADAWQFALRGAPPERNAQGQLVDPETGEVIEGGGIGPTGGCELEATQAVRGDFSVLADLQDEFADLDDRIEADARIAEIASEWTTCMRDLGFAYETVDEARDDFQQQLRPLLVQFFIGMGLQPSGEQGLAGQAANLQAMADHGLNDDQEAELAALQNLEISAAVASLECAGDTQTEIDEITARYEAEFVVNNRSVLEQIARGSS